MTTGTPIGLGPTFIGAVGTTPATMTPMASGQPSNITVIRVVRA